MAVFISELISASVVEMEQAALAQLATNAARLAEAGESDGLDELVRLAASAHGYAPWAMTNLIAGEWKRQGIIPTPILVPRGTHMRPV